MFLTCNFTVIADDIVVYCAIFGETVCVFLTVMPIKVPPHCFSKLFCSHLIFDFDSRYTPTEH